VSETKCFYLVNSKEFIGRLNDMKFRPQGKTISIVVQSAEPLQLLSTYLVGLELYMTPRAQGTRFPALQALGGLWARARGQLPTCQAQIQIVLSLQAQISSGKLWFYSSGMCLS